MKYEFEEKQDKEIAKGAANPLLVDHKLVTRLENGKNVLDALRSSGISEDDVIDFVQEAMQARAEHRSYLAQVEEGKKRIVEAQSSHSEGLTSLTQQMKEIVGLTQTLEGNRAVKAKANEYAIPLALAKAEKVLKKEGRKLKK